jgi:hypothetical protein
MSAILELNSTHFHYMHLAPCGSILAALPLQSEDAVGDTLQMSLAFSSGAVVEHKNGTPAACEKLFKAQYFASVSHRGVRQNF